MRILLVDDDAGAARALVAILNSISGHEVRTAHTGEEALAAAAEMSGVDLLITDVVMDPMDGFTLRDQLVAQYPNVRTILISGYDLSEYPEQTQNHQLLSKPVDTDVLRAAVGRELPPESEAPATPEPTPEPVPEPEPAAPAPVAEEAPVPEPEAAPAPIAVPAPVAVPVPVATPAPTPVAVPVRPVAVPVAVPVAAKAVAVPVAKPAAIPSPRVAMTARAVPAAAPAPAPSVKATPVARPTATAVPVPVPVPVSAQPVAKPQAVPAPTVTAVPVPVPVATPVAVPVPVAVSATPKAVPAAQPAPTAKATAVPRPAVAVPVPVATPAVPTPVAQPAAPAAPVATPVVATPAAAAVPPQPTVRMAPTVKAQPVPPPSTPGIAAPVAVKVPTAGVPVAKVGGGVPSPQAKPVATPAAVPVPVPRPATTAQTKALTPTPVSKPSVVPPPTVSVAPPAAPPSGISAPSLNPVMSGEDLSGKALGAYQLNRKMGESRWGGIYAGTQTSINRAVAIEVMDATKAQDENAQARFVADARAKAAVQHPSILAVYEAGEAEGRFFYAYEYVDGLTIAELKAAGKRLDEPSALKVLRVAADGLSYLNVHATPHTPPDANSVSLGNDGHPRLANLATQLADETLTPPQEIQALGRVMLGVLPSIQSLSPGLREMLKRMVQAGPQAMTSWGQVLQGVKALEPKVVPTDAAKINAQDRAAIAAVEQARKQQKRSFYYNITSVVTLIILIGVTAWYFLRNKQRIYDEQILIPEGEFVFANGQKKTLPNFWIDKYEVTFGQYAEFVKALEAHPTTEYDHKDQPKLKTTAMHKPYNWEIYYGNAREGRAAHSTPIDLSCPVLEVDFWDAYAYARWKGRELPTEEEWEKAARGSQGFLYPWGNDPDVKKTNSNADFNPNDPAALGGVDGFNFWNPVDKVIGDKSPYGIIGMAGNLREWTGTWNMRTRTVIAKGGCFKSPDSRVDQRVDLDPSAHDEALGFRTISRTPPSK